jgi:hypothetical protein
LVFNGLFKHLLIEVKLTLARPQGTELTHKNILGDSVHIVNLSVASCLH